MLRNKPFWIALVLLLVYLAGGYLLGPALLQPRLLDYARKETGRELEFASLRFDPITFSMVIDGVNLAESPGSLWPGVKLRAGEVHLRFNFWKLRPAVSDLLVVEPVVEAEAYQGKLYPFVSGWREWRAGSGRTDAGETIAPGRWRVESGRLLVSAGPASAVAQWGFEGIEGQVEPSGPGGLRGFSIAASLADTARLEVQGELDLARSQAAGGFIATGTPGTPGPDAGTGRRLDGRFSAELQEQGLAMRLTESRYQAIRHTLCWDQGFLCAQFAPVDASGEADLLLGGSGLQWQAIRAGFGAFELGLSLGRGSVRPGQPWVFTDGRLELGRQPVKVEVGSLSYEMPDYSVSLEAGGDLQLTAVGNFASFREVSELQFGMTGTRPMQGELRWRRIAAQQAQAPYSEVQLSLQNPGAGLAQDFIGRQWPGALEAGQLDLEMLARQEGEGLALQADIFLAGLGLVETAGAAAVTEWDPAWLLAMWQGPGQGVVFDLPDLEVGAGSPVNLAALLEAPLLELLRESMDDPFSALSRLTGTPAIPLDEIIFAAGSAALGQASAASLEGLGQALLQRPGLGLEAAPVYDPLIDLRALQTEQVRTHIALAGAAEPSFQSGAEPTDFSDAVVHSVIDEFARQRLPPPVLERFFEYFGLADVDQGIVPEGDVAAYYAALFELLVEYAEIPQGAMSTLARYRAQAVIDGLRKHGVEQTRLRTWGQARVAEARVDGIPMALQLFIAPGDEATGEESPEPGIEADRAGELPGGPVNGPESGVPARR